MQEKGCQGMTNLGVDAAFHISLQASWGVADLPEPEACDCQAMLPEILPEICRLSCIYMLIHAYDVCIYIDIIYVCTYVGMCVY